MKLFKWLYIKVLTFNLLIFALFSIIITYFSLKLPDRVYYYKRWIFKQRKWERNGELYQRVLKVKHWKRFLPELSDYIKSIYPKKHIKEYSEEYLQRYLVESCKSELTHWGIILSTPFFLLWADICIFLSILVIAIALNMPYIIIQRYNRPRIIQILDNVPMPH